MRRNLAAILSVGLLFTAGAVAVGLGIARALSLPRADVLALLAGFPSRSLSIATLISINVLGRVDFLAFAATFFLVQAAILIPLMLLARSEAPAPDNPQR